MWNPTTTFPPAPRSGVISAGDQVQVEFGVTEKTRSNLAAGDTVAISKNGTDYSGRVTEIGSMVNPSTGLYDVKAEVDRRTA